jgi:phosphatidyl-myo-inositol alpha-mannosyltransferase
MKIGLVCPYNIHKGGGVFELIRELRTGLIERGHEVKIITPQPREADLVTDKDIIFLGGGAEFRSPTHTTLQFSASVSPELIDQVLEREQFDILHFHEPWVPVVSRQILSRSKAVNIATFHGVVPETLMSRTVVRVVTPYATSILKYLHELTAVSDAAAEYIKSLTNDPVTIIPNGIDLARFHRPAQLPAPQKIRSILYLGRLERRKGVKYLLQAYRLLTQTETDVELIIAGDGPDRERLEMLSEDLHLKNVHFLGYVDEAAKLKLLRKATIYCSPALYGESFGIVLLEAMASGAITVAGNNSGYTTLMKGVGQLSIVNPRDEDEFARRLHLLLHEQSVRKLWYDWSGEYVQQFTYPNIISRYEELYKAALAKHR